MKDRELRLYDALCHHFEIAFARPKFLRRWADWSKSKTLNDLALEENREEQRRFLAENHVADIIGAYPMKGLRPSDFLGALSALQPRLYSLASSLQMCPDEAHITVGMVQYSLNGIDRVGVASGQLCERLNVDDSVPIFVQENKSFRLPANPDTPIVMIGAGTGVAPFRAFMQDREATENTGPSWLFFGDRNFRTDFLYQAEWQRLLKEGWLTQMDVAFSRDQDTKIYIQQRMLERAKELYGWLRDGAHIYVCGDLSGLAPGVHNALISIVAEQAGKSKEAASEYIRELQLSKRYQRDVY